MDWLPFFDISHFFITEIVWHDQLIDIINLIVSLTEEWLIFFVWVPIISVEADYMQVL